MLAFLSTVILSYLIGMVNPAYLIAKIKGFDIRTRGTKNAGTLNTYQTLGLLPAIIVFLFDAGKAALCFWLAKELFLLPEPNVYFSSFFVIIGHRYPFVMNFKGGKGVAAGIGLWFSAFFFRSSLEYWHYFLFLLMALYLITKFIIKR